MRDIIFIGDGLGVRTLPAKMLGLNIIGTDISEFAVNNGYIRDKSIYFVDDITDSKLIEKGEYAKVLVAYDILEHLTNKGLDKALKIISQIADNFIFSIPFVGDPNLEADKTHKQFKTKEEWIKLIESYNIKIKETPDDWLFKNQLLIGIK